MDEYTGKRAAGGLGFSRRGSSLTFRDPNQEGRNMQYCNRLGCSTRLSSMKGTQISNPEKPKYPKASFRSTSNRTMAGSSSKSFSASTDFRKPQQEPQNPASLRETAESSIRRGVTEDSESSSQLDGTEGSEFNPTTTGVQNMEEIESPILQGFNSNSTESSGSKSRKQINRWSASSSQDTSSSSSFRHSIASRSMSQALKPASQGLGFRPQRYGLKNLSCTSISDVLPSGCSSADSGHSRRVVSVRKRPSDGESSSTGGKGTSGSSSSSLSGPSGSQMPQQASRRARNQPASRDGPVSVRTHRASSRETRMRLPEQVDDNIVSISEPIMYPQLSHTQLSISEAVPEGSSRSFPIGPLPIFHSSFGRSGSSGRSARSRSGSRTEDGGTQMFHGPLGDRDGYRSFNMEGIEEVLLALERIEQDEELTYEQLLVLEANLFLGGLSFHDQHRDMRLDIDNMTYEELLALEEKMGNVSTALSEEALSKSLKRNMYTPASQFPGIAARGDDDIKCSICQEEYVVGDEVGKLACGHRYHVPCIHQWLRQKNWCPICKTYAASP